MSIFDEPINITPEFLEAHGCNKIPMKTAVMYEYYAWQHSEVDYGMLYRNMVIRSTLEKKEYNHERIKVSYQYCRNYKSCICLVVHEKWSSNYPECDPYVVIGDVPNISTTPIALEVVSNTLDIEVLAKKINDYAQAQFMITDLYPYEK